MEWAGPSGEIRLVAGCGDVRERPASARGASEAPFELVPSKLLPPLVRPGAIRRPLLGQLADEDPRRIVSVVAPPDPAGG
jgi:hypothetical protein